MGGYDWEDVVAVVFEVDEEDYGFRRCFWEEAVFRRRGCGWGGWVLVLVVQQFYQWVDVHGSKCSVGCQGVGAVADVEFLVEEPDVGFDACATPAKGIVEGNPSPVVVVRVAVDGRHVPRDVQQVFFWYVPVEVGWTGVVQEDGYMAQEDVEDVDESI